MLQNVFYVGIGGFLGASLRYIISLQLSKWFNSNIPIGTLTVNVIGGLLIGLIMEISLTTDLIPSNLRLFLTTGILGGLTTFSTFSYETIGLFYEGSYLFACVNICLNLFLSLFGVILGRLLCKIIF
ncbi:fluoride efflux transporter CrcB [Aceticella autotrophica]|uniref:fluoride efflux transporter CrcB n=1 Tax=Aceticella autotrophica TaxID=2755338 RepID=UPI002542BE27|nr:fluoride efflux transporter CrcB [Aceticella autotrophica]MDI6605395.1 fluoride efflux transporter CrcB [Thermoanaerobacteraceae bacterium]